MTVFVLVHGGWHGGWCWQEVAERLRCSGHRVYTPTLTGLADRSHLFSADIDLDTHIADVVNLARWEDLSEFVLCGHSYGGMVITGAADALRGRVSAAVYLDAFLPTDGDWLFDLAGWPTPTQIAMPTPSTAAFGLAETYRSRVDPKLTPHPTRTGVQMLHLTSTDPVAPRRTYVLATGWAGLEHFHDSYRRAVLDPSWTAISLDGSHELMFDRAEAVAEVLAHA